jgi:hypothetical protein
MPSSELHTCGHCADNVNAAEWTQSSLLEKMTRWDSERVLKSFSRQTSEPEVDDSRSNRDGRIERRCLRRRDMPALSQTSHAVTHARDLAG